jgi:uncharacterized membrane protein YphA (DoxX/SURF4 family)
VTANSAYLVVAILLSVGLVISGGLKLAKNPRIVEGIGGLSVPLSLFPVLAALEIAGATGLIIGLWFAPLGIAAGVGVVMYFAGAVVTHLRAHNREFAPPLVLAMMGTAAVALRLLSL